jgi:hypothetical protein
MFSSFHSLFNVVKSLESEKYVLQGLLNLGSNYTAFLEVPDSLGANIRNPGFQGCINHATLRGCGNWDTAAWTHMTFLVSENQFLCWVD